jgi:uncharacterized damage-inducible protein DinB
MNKMNLLETAGKVSDSDYGFKPTPDVRTLAEVLNHIAGSQMRTCSSILGTSMTYSAPAANASKADVMAALKASFEVCDRAYSSLTDQNGMQMVRSYRGEVPKLAALMMNNDHDAQEYGVLTVYMRLKGIVPPSTARAMGAREGGEHRDHKHLVRRALIRSRSAGLRSVPSRAGHRFSA